MPAAAPDAAALLTKPTTTFWG